MVFGKNLGRQETVKHFLTTKVFEKKGFRQKNSSAKSFKNCCADIFAKKIMFAENGFYFFCRNK